MTKTNFELDQESRQIIVSDLKKNYFVEASAGSGKTSSLVNRMVALVESGVPVDEICTITFTKAAANEFFERFQNLLSLRSNIETPKMLEDPLKHGDLPRTTMESRALAQKALLNIDSCFMGTIDAFCNMIAHELPKEFNIPSFSSIISNDEKIELIKSEYHKIIINPSNPLHEKAKLFNNLFDNAINDFSLAASELIDSRNCNLVYDKKYFIPGYDLETEIEYLNKKKHFLDYLNFLYEYTIEFGSVQNKEAYKKLKSPYIILRDNPNKWGKNISQLNKAVTQASKIEFKKGLYFKSTRVKDFLEEEGKSLVLKKTYVDTLSELTNFLNEYKHAVLMDLINDVLHIISENLRQKGKLTFNDYLFYLCDAFKKSSNSDGKLIGHITQRHKYFMLDESQDTNPIQTHLFFYLNSTVKTDNWKEAKPKGGSLFIVGDPKQSIYGFRNADVNAYMETRKIFQDENEYLVLYSNFRSNENLVKWFNGTMNDLLKTPVQPLKHPDIPLDNIKKERIDAANKATMDGVFAYTSVIKNSKTIKIDDSNTVIKLVSELYDKNDVTIGVKEGKKFITRKVRFNDFLIVPRGKDMKRYVEACKKLNIPVVIEGKQNFKACVLLNVLKDILFLLNSPRNELFIFNVLKGEMFCLTDYEIAYAVQNKISLSIVNKTDAKGIVADALNLLNELYIETKNMSNSSIMMFLLNNEKLNAFSKLGAENLEYYYFFVELLREKEATGDLNSPKKLYEFTEDFLLGKTDHERCLRFKDKIDAVKISNLHKVKGLQAPIVILCDPLTSVHKPKTKVDGSDLYVFEISDPDPSKHYTAIKSSKYDDPYKKNAIAEELAEGRRIEYVGATRPESVLIIGQSTLPDGPDNVNPWGNLIKSSVPLREIEKQPYLIDKEEKDLIIPRSEENIDNVLQSVSLIKPSALNKTKFEDLTPSRIDNKLSSFKTNKDDIDEDIDKTEDEKKSCLIGTLVHKLMETLVISKRKIDLSQLIDDVVKEYNAIDCKGMLLQVADTLFKGGFKQKNGCFDDDILNILLNSKQVMCEVPFSYYEDNKLLHGIMDCVFEDDNGWHILDYKTNKEDDVNVLMTDHYAGQMDAYKKAFKKITGLDATVGIYHISIKQ